MQAPKNLVEINKNYLACPWGLAKVLKIHEEFTFDYEEELKKKYSGLKNDQKDKIQAKDGKQNNDDMESSYGIIMENYSSRDFSNLEVFRALCPDIKSDEEARFYLEATSNNVEEAEKLYREDHFENKKPIVDQGKQDQKTQATIINVTIQLADNKKISHTFLKSDFIWEIGPLVYQATGSNKEFRSKVIETNKCLSMEELSFMTFSQLNIQNSCTFIIEFL